MSPRFQLRPRAYLGTPSSKQSFNLALFSEVAPKYDLITGILSLGRDASWKRRLVADLPEIPAPQCVDLACGTGDLTHLLARRFQDGHVVGIDLTPAMLEIARNRFPEPNATYTEGTMDRIPLRDASVDVVTGGYALRNAPDLDRALDEVSRVLRSGGCAAFLDFSKPPSRPGQVAGHIALKLWGGFWGLALHGNPDVYGYIADSLRLFPARDELRARFQERQFVLRSSRRFYGGLVESVVFEKLNDVAHLNMKPNVRRPA